MPIAYVAQTRDHLLMLDDDGICLHIHRRSKERGDDATDGALCCVGAQFVAALDPKEAGYLAHAPTLGVPMLFAKVGANGRVSIVRTGPLERFVIHNAKERSATIEYVADDEDEPTHRFRRAGKTHGRPTLLLV